MTFMRKGTAVRRTVFALAATALTVGALTACSGGSTGGSNGGSADDIEKALQEGGEITYWSWTPSARRRSRPSRRSTPR